MQVTWVGVGEGEEGVAGVEVPLPLLHQPLGVEGEVAPPHLQKKAWHHHLLPPLRWG